MKQHLAHIARIDGKRVEQTVEEHSRATAEYAGKALKSVGLYSTGYLAGLIHDMLKSKKEYQDYLERAFLDENVVRGSVNHTFGAVKLMIDRYYPEANTLYRALTCEIIAIAAGSHHALFDLDDPTGVSQKNGLAYRVEYDEDEIGYKEALKNFLEEVADYEELDCLFEEACKEIEAVIRTIEKNKAEYKADGMYLQFEYLTRMITSAVMEGDRRNTAEFMNGKSMPTFGCDAAFWEDQLRQLEQKLEEFSSDTPINQVRQYISDSCCSAGKRPPGIYRLTVPTGSGKTLSSLRYALSHAATFEKKRIIFIIPLLSVLDQNSKDIHEHLNAEGMILEHHSNVISYDETQEELDQRELLTETWDAPIIISTLVQLLQILFSHKTSAVRRMNALCNSVIIIDEVQSLPLKFSRLFSMAVNFLVECCNATVVLCSATQPAFELLEPALHVGKEDEIVNLDLEMEKVFRRADIINKITPTGMSIEELADFAVETIETRDSVLIICNTKSEARNLFKNLKLMTQGKYTLYHLSTSMCPKHREQILNQIGKVPGLGKRKKVICVATQMVECGIDFSFESVIRIEAGLDSIVQAAGRCNRSNEWDKICQVFIVRLKNENLSLLPSIREAQACFAAVNYELGPDVDFMSDTFIHRYFQRFFKRSYSNTEMNYAVDIGKNKDVKSSVIGMLHMHKKSNDGCFYRMRQAFRTAGESCKVFDDNKTDVIINYDDYSNECILNISSGNAEHDLGYVKEQLGKLKPYIVSLFEHELRQLKIDEMLEYHQNTGILILDKSAYNSDFGVSVSEYSNGDYFMNS